MKCLLFDLDNTLLDWPQEMSQVRPRVEVLDLLRSLTGTKAIVTAGSRKNQQRKYRASGLDSVIAPQNFFSCRVGVPKTKPILEALEYLGFTPQQTLFVGDDPEYDIQSAHRVGCATAWISHGRVFPQNFPQPTYTLTTFSELGGLFHE